MNYSEETIKRFVKDYDLPIQVTKPEFFDYYIDLYDKVFDSKRKLELLNEAIASAGGETEFAVLRNKFTDTAIKTIKELDAYRRFDEMDIEIYPILPKIEGVPFNKSSDIYKTQNIGNKYISIDLTSANFQSLRYVDPDIVLGASDYKELVSKISDLDYFKNSKHIRQILFGNLNVSRQIRIERFITGKILEYLIRKEGISSERFVLYTNDEIVLTDEGDLNEGIEEFIKENTGADAHVERFTLNSIGECYVKLRPDGTIKFKKAPIVLFPQIYKKFFGLPINDKDLLFLYEGRLSKFCEPIF